MKHLKLNRRIVYVSFVIVFFIFWFLFKVGGMPDIPLAVSSTFIDILFSITSLIITVEFLLPRLFYKKRYVFFLAFFFLFVLLAGSAIILAQLRLQGTSLSDYPQNVAKSRVHFYYWFWADLVLGSYFLVFFISAAGASIRFAFDRLNADNEIAMLEKMSMTAELKSLKDQINPHFLFNALNTVYYKIDKTNIEARHILQKFSEMLRYQLYDCDSEYTKIESELQFLKSYIELQKSRLNNNYEVVYKGFDDRGNFLIAPFLLMPIIENCFKHVSDFSDRPNHIQIEIKVEGSCLKLNTFNTFQIKPDTHPGGIGLENVKKRLDYLYENKYSMEMKSSELFFETHLTLSLN